MISDEEWDNYGEEFSNEFGAYARVGLPGSELVRDVPMTRREQAAMNPLDRFRLQVNGIARNLQGWDIDISNEDIHIMLETAEDLRHVEHKNPSAYILGYLASNGGKNIDIKRFDYIVKNVLTYVENVMPPDIIRYARMWMNL